MPVERDRVVVPDADVEVARRRAGGRELIQLALDQASAGTRSAHALEQGGLALVDPDPKEYKELARSKVCGNTWAHPALAGGRLYLRDRKEFICLAVSQ